MLCVGTPAQTLCVQSINTSELQPIPLLPGYSCHILTRRGASLYVFPRWSGGNNVTTCRSGLQPDNGAGYTSWMKFRLTFNYDDMSDNMICSALCKSCGVSIPIPVSSCVMPSLIFSPCHSTRSCSSASMDSSGLDGILI